MNKKLLIVDDDEELCLELSDILRGEGYSVDTISNTTQAQALIHERSHDGYLLDYKMAGLSGVDLLKQIKAKDAGSKVFLISGRPNVERLLEEENVAHLVTALIHKPFDIEFLLRTLRASV
jgi:two-component system OmpR family response regulator